MLRVAQEGLVNAAKHSASQPVTVRLDHRDCEVRLVVRNDLPTAGPGPRPAVPTANMGYGLTGMRERLRILDGTLEAGPSDGAWVAAAHVPLPGSMAP